VQKEAFFFSKHCITLREQTEWVELVENGFNTLVGTDKALLHAAFHDMKSKQSDFSLNLYGNGTAAEQIAITLKKA
jgi:UDP-GlcNAc3NAcA epimerase